jgi:hypothetical protein
VQPRTMRTDVRPTVCTSQSWTRSAARRMPAANVERAHAWPQARVHQQLSRLNRGVDVLDEARVREVVAVIRAIGHGLRRLTRTYPRTQRPVTPRRFARREATLYDATSDSIEMGMRGFEER